MLLELRLPDGVEDFHDRHLFELQILRKVVVVDNDIELQQAWDTVDLLQLLADIFLRDETVEVSL